MRIKTIAIAAGAVVTAAGIVWSQGRGNPTDWPTAYGDAQHTSWIRADVSISPESMSAPGFELQWKTQIESPARQGVSLTQGVVTSAVNLFTPLSTLAGPSNQIFSLDNDTGNLFWTRRFDGALGAGTAACPGGISGAPTRIANLTIPPIAPPRGGGRGAQSYSSSVGEPGAGVPVAPRAGGGAAAGRGVAAAPATGSPTAPPAPARGNAPGATPAAQPPPSPFPTNPQAVAAAGGAGGGLFRSSGVVYTVSADGMLRTLGLVSGKDVQRPAPFLPAGARFSDLIGVGDMIYTATSQGCGGAANGIWAINVSGDPKTVVSWPTNGGNPIGSVAFATNGTVIAAIGPGVTAPGGYANAIVALDPTTLALRDWFTQPGVEFVSAPLLFQEGSTDVVATTTKDGRILLLDAAFLGGANHATPLFASTSLTGGAARSASQSPAMWQERGATTAAATGPGAGVPAALATPVSIDGARWLLLPEAGRIPAIPGATAHGAVSTGAILAVQVSQQAGAFSVQSRWVSENITAPLTPIVVNGVVFVASGPPNVAATLYALDAVTGKTLWHSGRVISSALSGRSLWTGSGQVYVGALDGTVYAFGFAMERK